VGAPTNGRLRSGCLVLAAGDQRSEIHDSVSFAGAFRDPSFGGRTHTYTEFRGDDGVEWAVRDRRYKLITFPDGRKAAFDLASDPSRNRT
jgi:hypothetical protein